MLNTLTKLSYDHTIIDRVGLAVCVSARNGKDCDIHKG